MDYVIVDATDKEVKVGSKVRYVDAEDIGPENVAEVIEITDWDGDVDDNTGRSITIEPRVKVRYPSSEVETWRTSEWEFDWESPDPSQEPDPGPPEYVPTKGKVEELVVVG